jgi:uncharacterized protein (TIGR00369 family)
MAETAQTRSELIRAFIPASPLARHLGIELDALEPDRARLRLPFAEHVVTMGDVVHGGAISTLIDTTATAAAWSIDEVPESMAGATVSMAVDFVAAARGKDLTAEALIVRRGRSLVFCEVTVTEPDERIVAKGLVTYRLG